LRVEFSGFRVDYLTEFLEQALLMLLIDADTVIFDSDPYHHFMVNAGDLDISTGFREFYRIAQQVDDYLPQAILI
jgi:hypothetical protein